MSSSSDVTCLSLSKQDFKFSSAHFLIFDGAHAEKLHGHNYRVRVKLWADPVSTEPQGDPQGFVVDFGELKKVIRARLAHFDEHVLLPGRSPHLRITAHGESYEVRYAERLYVFPREDVLILPTPNTSVECLSRLLCEEWFKLFATFGARRLLVSVEETAGQSASFSCGG